MEFFGKVLLIAVVLHCWVHCCESNRIWEALTPSVNISLNSDELNLKETEFVTTEFNLTGNIPDSHSLSITIDDPRIAELVENATLDLQNGATFVSGAFRTRGKRLGLGILTFHLHPSSEEPEGDNSTQILTGVQVIVLRRS